MRYTFCLLIATLIFSGCKTISEESTAEKPKSNQIVLIFNKPVSHGFYQIPNAGTMSQGRTTNGDEVQYIDDRFIQRRLTVDFESKSDTVTIHSTRDWVEVMLMYKGVDDLSYQFKNGDTVVFNYDGMKPIANIINRQEHYRTTNFSLYTRDSIANDDYNAIDIVTSPMLVFHKYNTSLKDAWENIIKDGTKNLTKETELAISALNELKEKGSIDSVQYNARIRSLYAKFQMLKSRANNSIEKLSSSTINKSLTNLEALSPELLMKNDSLLYNMDHAKSLAVFVSSVYHKDIKMLQQQTKGGGGSTKDYRQYYDSIRASTELTPIEKKVIQYGNINALLSQPSFFNIESRLKYLTRFRNDFKDTILVNELSAKYNMKFQIDDEVNLESINGKTNTLQGLIAENKNKVIYVDYWASWCAPCIREMPSSKALQSQYADKDVMFIYISTDRSKKAWVNSIKKHDLNIGHHYRITNANTSKGFEELNIPFIPRYMVYNDKGQLVNNDAPRPSDANLLATEFNKYLSSKK